MKRSFNTGAVLLLACVLGVGGGIALSLKKQHDALHEIDARVDALNPGDGVEAIQLASGEEHDVTTPDPESLRGLPVFPGSDPRKIVGVAGSQMNVSWFSTEASFNDVIGFYREAFDKAGLMSVWHAFNEREGYVAWLERDPWQPDAGVQLPDGLLHMATVIRESDQTVVLLSSTRPTAVVDSASVAPGWFVAMPEASEPRFIDTSTDGTLHQTVYFDWPAATAQQVLQTVRERYQSQGWEPQKVSTTAVTSRENLMLKKGTGEIELQVEQNENTVAVVMTAHELRNAP